MPSQRIFLLRQRSQAWAIRLCEFDPTLITFIGSIPGILVIVNCVRRGCATGVRLPSTLGSHSVATSHETQTHQTSSSIGREKETAVSSNGCNIEGRRVEVGEKVLREEVGCVRGAKFVGIRCAGWAGRGKTTEKVVGKGTAADVVSGGHSGVGSSCGRSLSPCGPGCAIIVPSLLCSPAPRTSFSARQGGGRAHESVEATTTLASSII
jgi:hypothetical protein